MHGQDNALLGFTADAPAPEAADPMSFLTGGSPSGAAAAVDHFSGVPLAQGSGVVGRAVPEVNKLREWEDQHAKDLDDLSRREEADRKGRRAKASDELTNWHGERTSSISKKKSANRADEGTAQSAREAAEKQGANPWERVVDLISTSARPADEARDTSRMRALLIQLKSNPVVAVG